MRKLFTLFAFVAIFSFAGTASAGIHQCPDGSWHTNCGNHQLPPEPPAPPAPEVPGNTNTNTNTATGGAGGDGGNASVFGSGNSASHSGSSSTSGVDFGSRNDFGGDGGDASLGAFNDFGGSSDQDQGQLQGQQQGQAQGQDNDVDVSISDNSVHSIDNDFPVNTAAPVFAGNCSQGVSGQTMGFGGSVASGNPVCDYIAVAGAYIAGGDRAEAFRVLTKAEDAADWRAVFAKIRMCLTLGLL
jgi:hypothetical protein